jgi:hypothetical protein
MPSFSSALPRKKTRVKIIDEKKMTCINWPLDFFTGPSFDFRLAGDELVGGAGQGWPACALRTARPVYLATSSCHYRSVGLRAKHAAD